MQINTGIVPSFFSVLAAVEEESRVRGLEKLRRDLQQLVEVADEKASLSRRLQGWIRMNANTALL